jgi:hypothetical protein
MGDVDGAWERAVDDAGNAYFYNSATGESSWQIPEQTHEQRLQGKLEELEQRLQGALGANDANSSEETRSASTRARAGGWRCAERLRNTYRFAKERALHSKVVKQGGGTVLCMEVTDSAYREVSSHGTGEEQWLFSGAADGEVRRFDVKTSQCVRIYRGHCAAVNQLAVFHGRLEGRARQEAVSRDPQGVLFASQRAGAPRVPPADDGAAGGGAGAGGASAAAPMGAASTRRARARQRARARAHTDAEPWLLSAGEDGAVCVHHALSAALLFRHQGGGRPVHCLAVRWPLVFAGCSLEPDPDPDTDPRVLDGAGAGAGGAALGACEVAVLDTRSFHWSALAADAAVDTGGRAAAAQGGASGGAEGGWSDWGGRRGGGGHIGGCGGGCGGGGQGAPFAHSQPVLALAVWAAPAAAHPPTPHSAPPAAHAKALERLGISAGGGGEGEGGGGGGGEGGLGGLRWRAQRRRHVLFSSGEDGSLRMALLLPNTSPCGSPEGQQQQASASASVLLLALPPRRAVTCMRFVGGAVPPAARAADEGEGHPSPNPNPNPESVDTHSECSSEGRAAGGRGERQSNCTINCALPGEGAAGGRGGRGGGGRGGSGSAAAVVATVDTLPDTAWRRLRRLRRRKAAKQRQQGLSEGERRMESEAAQRRADYEERERQRERATRQGWYREWLACGCADGSVLLLRHGGGRGGGAGGGGDGLDCNANSDGLDWGCWAVVQTVSARVTGLLECVAVDAR